MTQTGSKYAQNIDLIKGLAVSKLNNKETAQFKIGKRFKQFKEDIQVSNKLIKICLASLVI